MIEISNLTKYYRKDRVEQLVVENLNLKVEQGGSLALMGPSGSGKTTVLNIIAGLDADYSGNVIIDNQNLKELGKEELNRYRNATIGFIFQEFNLLPHLNALENVLITLMFSDISHSQAKTLGIKALDTVGLKDYWNRRPAELSGGQKQRVAVARALINRPKIILADEPTANLDTKTEKSVLDLIMRLASEENATLIVSTHRGDIASLAASVVELDDIHQPIEMETAP
jgi:putative ABC transport system ATP-binding protein